MLVVEATTLQQILAQLIVPGRVLQLTHLLQCHIACCFQYIRVSIRIGCDSARVAGQLLKHTKPFLVAG